jgi:hypothetical protein
MRWRLHNATARLVEQPLSDTPPQPDALPALPESGSSSFWSGLLTTLDEGAKRGLLQVLTNKQVSDAIGRLVAGIVDYPMAWVERGTQSVRDETAARSDLRKAINAAATKQALADPAVITRGMERLLKEAGLKQTNREEVAKQALHDLAQNPPDAEQTSAPSADFMNHFADHAERASSEQMRDTFARILAGELRKPGSFSLRTMQFMATMDQELAAAVQAARDWQFGQWLHTTKRHQRGLDLVTLRVLEQVGLLSTGLTRTVEAAKSHCSIFAGELCVTWQTAEATIMDVDGAYLSSVGMQVMSLTKPVALETYARELAIEYLDSNGSVKAAYILHSFRNADGTLAYKKPVLVKSREQP